MLRDSFYERRSRRLQRLPETDGAKAVSLCGVAQAWTQFDHTDHTKILDTDSCVCYFHILIRADFIGLSLRKINKC